MAIVKGMNFKRGKLGDIGFRQQYTKNPDGSYSKSTVAFTLTETNSSNSPLQQRQRTRFALIQSLATIFSKKGLLRTFYRTALGLSGYNGFIRDNINYAVVENGGQFFVDFPKLMPAFGDFRKNIEVFTSDVVPGNEGEFARKLAWNYEILNDPEDASDYLLMIYGIKINEDGAVEDVELIQPLHRMSECTADIVLKDCNCCKVYYYAFFANPMSGYFTTSNYIGTSETEVQAFDETCFVCDMYVPVGPAIPPGEDLDQCCGKEDVDKSNIVYNGTSTSSSYGRLISEPRIAVPGDCALHTPVLTYESTWVWSQKVNGGTGSVMTITDSNGISVSSSQTLENYRDEDVLMNELNAALIAAGSTAQILSMVYSEGSPEDSIDISIRDVTDNLLDMTTPTGSTSASFSFATPRAAQAVQLSVGPTTADLSNILVDVDGTVVNDEAPHPTYLIYEQADGPANNKPAAITVIATSINTECGTETWSFVYNAATGLFEESTKKGE